MRELKQSSSGSSRGSSLSSINGTVTAIAEELADGSTKVGKITFDPDRILGKGCEGTFVFRLVSVLMSRSVISVETSACVTISCVD